MSTNKTSEAVQTHVDRLVKPMERGLMASSILLEGYSVGEFAAILQKYQRMEMELQAIHSGGDPWSRSVAAEALAFDPLPQ
jgi:hypothetical protein